ncbi:MAG: hypothetical protein VCB43_09085, partial [Myxococcota bacterium]
MDWVGASVLATIVAALLLASLPSRRLEVGTSGDWILGWAALLFSGMSNLFPIPGELAPVLAASTAPLFPVLML